MFESGYGAVEAALAESYRIPSKAMGAFRGRLGALQKQGLFGTKNMPGKGRALRYGPDQLHRIIFACELFEFGVGPSVVLEIVRTLWERRVQKIFKDAEEVAERDPGPEDVILHMGGVHDVRSLAERARSSTRTSFLVRSAQPLRRSIWR